MKDWRTLLVVAVVAAVGLTVVAMAFAKSGAAGTTRRVGGSACRVLMSNPKAFEAMKQLRAEHRKDMQVWLDRYAADPSSAAAQKALWELRRAHFRDMRDLLQKAGVKVPEGQGTRAGACGGSGLCGGPGSGPQVSGYGGGMMGGGWGY